MLLHINSKNLTVQIGETSVQKTGINSYHLKRRITLLINFDYYNYKYIERIEYQKTINLVGNTNNQPSIFRTKNWVEVNDKSHERYNPDGEINFKATMLRSSLCNYSDAYILVKGTITVSGGDTATRQLDKRNKQATFKNCGKFH